MKPFFHDLALTVTFIYIGLKVAYYLISWLCRCAERQPEPPLEKWSWKDWERLP